ncbi:MAG: helix-turn-helix transcriptional regulator [Coriobacteriia bacterium]
MPYQKPAEIGAFVREQRKQYGFTQKDLAMHANVGVRFISDLENGKPTVELGKVLAVLSILGVDVDLIPRREKLKRYEA